MTSLNVDQDGVVGQLLNAPDFGIQYQDALRWMRRPKFLETAKWRQQQWSANREGAYKPLVAWERAFVNRFRKLGVPVYCQEFVRSKFDHERLLTRKIIGHPFGEGPHNFGYAVRMVHSILGSDMPRICWEIFQHVGEEIAEATALDLEWCGPEHPASWQMRPWKDWKYNPPVAYNGDPPF